jgi:hypothetical protein
MGWHTANRLPGTTRVVPVVLLVGNAGMQAVVARSGTTLRTLRSPLATDTAATTHNAATERGRKRRARRHHVGRPKALDKSKTALARRMHGHGEPAHDGCLRRGYEAGNGLSCAGRAAG